MHELIVQESEYTIKEVEKSQLIRLVDVFFIAPALIYASYKANNLSDILRIIVLVIGVATLFYNGRNYLKNQKKKCE